MSTSATLAKVIKAGGVSMLPTQRESNPASREVSRSSTPLQGKSSLKKSSRIVPQASSMHGEMSIVDLENLEPFEIATYEINTGLAINAVNFNIMCPDDLEPIRSQLKSIDGDQFTITLFNTTDTQRILKISYIIA